MTDLQTMETSLYEDHCYTSNMSGESSRNGDDCARQAPKRPATQSITDLKKSLTLDFTSPESAKKTLQTPDVLRFLQLTSPELEKFLSQGVAVVTTPTPTQFLFPKDVTAQQEQYARGFIDALNQLHQINGFVPQANLLSPGFLSVTATSDSGASSSLTLTSVDVPVSSKLQSPTRDLTSVIMQTVAFPGAQLPAHASTSFLSSQGSIAASMALLNMKRETERPPSQSLPPGTMEFTTLTQAPISAIPTSTIVMSSNPPSLQPDYMEVSVDSVSSVGSPLPSSSTPLPANLSMSLKQEDLQTVPNVSLIPGGVDCLRGPMDLDKMERAKLERKRARNRLAATKCRQRKMERITCLEDEVDKKTMELQSVSAQLDTYKDDVRRLRLELESHRSRGCPIPDFGKLSRN